MKFYNIAEVWVFCWFTLISTNKSLPIWFLKSCHLVNEGLQRSFYFYHLSLLGGCLTQYSTTVGQSSRRTVANTILLSRVLSISSAIDFFVTCGLLSLLSRCLFETSPPENPLIVVFVVYCFLGILEFLFIAIITGAFCFDWKNINNIFRSFYRNILWHFAVAIEESIYDGYNQSSSIMVVKHFVLMSFLYIA